MNFDGESAVSVRFGVLGPLQVYGDRGRIQLAGHRMERMLAVLLVNRGEIVDSNRLIDALWDDRPPATARRQLQNSVSALRRRLAEHGEAGRVMAVNGCGYRIRLAPGDLDAMTFADQFATGRRLAAQDQLAAAVEQMRSALKLWRGAALSGLTGRVITTAARGLDEQRLTVLEECLELELRLGRQHSLVGELAGLVERHPLRETLVGHLMLALYRCGRQAEALRVYHRLRELLAEEMGLEPGSRLRKLHAAILTEDPTVGAADDSTVHLGSPSLMPPPEQRTVPMVLPAQLPTDIAHFNGRAEHLRELTELRSRDAAGNATAAEIVAIVGMAGVGKTALAVHWAHLVADRFPDGQLYVNLRGFDASGSMMPPLDAVRAFLEALGVTPERIPATLDARVTLYRSVLTGRRVLILLDNAGDVAQARPLLPSSPGCLTLVTSRSQLSGLVAIEGAKLVNLDPFTGTEARQMLAGRLGRGRVDAEPDATDELITACARLPLALAVVAARAAAYPAFPLGALAADLRLADRRLDAFIGEDPAADVRAVLSWSLARISPPAARVFRLLGLHPGPDFTAPAAASIAATTAGGLRPILGELTRANLLSEHAPGRYAFHDLLRAYAIEQVESVETGDERDAAVQRLLDHYLFTAHAADYQLDPHRDPIEAMTAVPGVLPEPIADHAAALAWFIAEYAVLREVITHAERAGHDVHAWRLVWTMAHFFERRGEWTDWAAAQRTGLAAASRLADRDAQAHAHRSLGRVHVHLGRADAARSHLNQAMHLYRETDHCLGQARIHLDLGWLASREGDHQRDMYHSTSALRLFRTADHQSGQGRALGNIGWSRSNLGDHRRALAAFTGALAVQQRIDDKYALADTWDGLGTTHQFLGEHEHAVDCHREALARFRELGARYRETEILTHLGDTYASAGRADAARVVWQQAMEILEEIDHPDADRVRAKLGQVVS